MALKNIHDEIKRFLSSSTPEVLCIKGRWGVGKTFAWNTFLREAQSKGEVALPKYAYTSLFGVKNLDDLKHSIFENTIKLQDLEKDIDADDFSSKWDKAQRGYRKALTAVTANNFVQQYIGGSHQALFYFVRKQIVCIDDFERAGSGLEPIEILGLISFLKEQRKCKVVFLLNDEELKDKSKEIFEKQLEKVSDTVLSFLPTPPEAAGIAYPDPVDGTAKLLHDFSVQLGIVNIRVIKKIEVIAKRLIEIVGEKYPKLIYQMVHSATLFGWSFYQPTVAPPLDYYKDTTRMMGLLHGTDKLTADEEVWNALIRSYNFMICDEFDLVIMKGIKDGYFDENELLKEAEKANLILLKQEQDDSLTKAWQKYHYSFEDNEEEVLTDIFEAASKTIKAISPLNLNSTIKFLKEFDKDEKAKELIVKFVEANPDDKEVYNINGSILFGEEIDPDLKQAFETKFNSFVYDRNLSEVLIEINKNPGWGLEDMAFLATKSADDYYALFKQPNGEKARQILNGALMFKSISNPSDDMKTVNENVIAALKKIGGENRINARRIRALGIEIDNQ